MGRTTTTAIVVGSVHVVFIYIGSVESYRPSRVIADSSSAVTGYFSRTTVEGYCLEDGFVGGAGGISAADGGCFRNSMALISTVVRALRTRGMVCMVYAKRATEAGVPGGRSPTTVGMAIRSGGTAVKSIAEAFCWKTDMTSMGIVDEVGSG